MYEYIFLIQRVVAIALQSGQGILCPDFSYGILIIDPTNTML